MVNPTASVGIPYLVRPVSNRNAAEPAAPGAKSAESPAYLTPPAKMSAKAPLLIMSPEAFQTFAAATKDMPPPDKTSPYWVELDTVRTEPKAPLQETATVGWIPGDVAFKGGSGLTNWLRDRASDIQGAARRERDLSAELGQEVRLAFDPSTGREVALTAEDARFAHVKGAQDALRGLPRELGLMQQKLSDFEDLLRI